MEQQEWLEQSKKAVDNGHITLGELMKEVKNNAKSLYPQAAMFTACAEPFNGNSIIYTVSEFGDSNLVVDALMGAMQNDERAMRHIQSAYMNFVIELNPERLCSSANDVRNAIIDYANYLGKDIGNAQKHISKASERKSSPIANLADLEQRITETEAELRRLKQMRQPVNIVKYLEAERKRLMRAGRTEEAKVKTQEIEAVERAERTKKKRLDNLVKAREKSAENRAKRKKQKEQALHPQIQFNVLGAKKLKQMKRDKAERAKSKKKAQEGKSYNVKSTSTIFA